MILHQCLTVIWVAMLPVLELRAAIPLGLSFGLPPWASLALGIIGSMIPVPLIMAAFRPIRSILQKHGFFTRFLDKYQARAASFRTTTQRYGLWALAAFVAVPLPSTGAWTGAILASLLGLRPWGSFLAIFFGTVMAGMIVVLMSLGAASLISS